MPQQRSKATAGCHWLPFDRFAVDAGCRSDRGRIRPLNEDSVCVVVPEDPEMLSAKGVLMVVADGMGGHEGGELASSMAVERVRADYYRGASNPGRALAAAFERANQDVFDHARRHPKLAGMGTTCTAAAVVNGFAWLAHVGDSRLYLVRGGSAYRMTQDHSATMELVNRGLLTLAEADRHEERNVILRALGTHERLEVATWKDPFPLHTGDRLVLCSDGLYETIPDDELGDICTRQGTSAQACDALLRTALDRDGTDNITVAVLYVSPESEEARK
ncbi:MAG: protein phosphatase 2C domain-containing protein [Acidobacteriia bacterium]|nr:protein phosphatase 2C domain-containing protein [Terriglobia bacterium]